MKSLRDAALSFAAAAALPLSLPSASMAQDGVSFIRAETVCKAGCNGNTRGCQDSGVTAYLVASRGSRLRRGSLTMVRRYDKPDGPGINGEPEWEITSYPVGDESPLTITVKPNIKTCVGRSPDTQGITTYVFEAAQRPE